MSQEKIDLPDIVLPAKFKTGFESSDCAATSVLKQHGKSFHLAGRFLSGKRFAAAARLYAFCRQVDDIADESEDKNQAKEELALIRQSLIINKPLHPATIDVLALSLEWGLPTHSLQSLVCGVAMDLETVEIADERSLIRYCYYVAGTVGEMMCPILNSREGGTPFAIDLGIAMQMTNIARDVVEDAQMARRYLPTDWVDGLSAHDILNASDSDKQTIASATKKLLSLADKYYASAQAGLRYLPFRSRVAIAAALAVYREIGVVLRDRQYDVYQGRVVVSKLRKTKAMTQMLLGLRQWTVRSDKAHEPALHEAIASLRHHSE